MINLSEKETREKYIDPILEEVGWREEYIKREVNSVTSDFKNNKYEFKKGFGKEEGRFIDYVLVYEDQSPIAIIEAKRFSLDPEKGTIQATTYQKDIESKKGIAIPIFLTNGKKWYIKEKGYPMREISGPFSQQSLKKKLDNVLRKKDISLIDIMQIPHITRLIEIGHFGHNDKKIITEKESEILLDIAKTLGTEELKTKQICVISKEELIKILNKYQVKNKEIIANDMIKNSKFWSQF